MPPEGVRHTVGVHGRRCGRWCWGREVAAVPVAPGEVGIYGAVKCGARRCRVSVVGGRPVVAVVAAVAASGATVAAAVTV